MERANKFFTSLGGRRAMSLAAIVGGVVALYVAFAGGDNSSNTPPPPPPVPDVERSPRELAERRQSICRDADSQVIALGPSPGGDPDDSYADHVASERDPDRGHLHEPTAGARRAGRSASRHRPPARHDGQAVDVGLRVDAAVGSWRWPRSGSRSEASVIRACRRIRPSAITRLSRVAADRLRVARQLSRASFDVGTGGGGGGVFELLSPRRRAPPRRPRWRQG